MASEKSLYWIALGIFALGVVNGPARQIAAVPEQLTAHLTQMAENVSGRLAGRVETASLIFDDREASFCDRTQPAAARAEARIACAQAAVARRQAALDRVQAVRIRTMNRVVVVRPHPSIRVNLPLHPAKGSTI